MWTVAKWMRFINNLGNQRKVTMEQRIHCDTNTPTINRIDIDRLFLLDHHLPMESAYIVSTFPFCTYKQLDRVSSFGRFYAHWASEWTSISGNVIHAHNIQEAKHQHTQHMQHALSIIGRVCSNLFFTSADALAASFWFNLSNSFILQRMFSFTQYSPQK